MICNKCGKTLPDDSAFCQFCGSKIEIIAVSTDETPSVSKEEVLAKVLAAGVVEGQKAMEANKESQPHNELDADFGLVPQKPVYTVGIDEQEKYLKSLRTINGEPIKWNRRGSMSVDGVNGMVDVYDTFMLSGEEYKTIYINMYGAYNATMAPRGFMLCHADTTLKRTTPHKRKASPKWVVPVIISVALVIVVAIIGVLLGIPAAKYNDACTKLDNGFYEEAIEIFKDLDGYKNSEEKILEAKYEYILQNHNNDNRTTYTYLKELKKIDYKDCVNLYKKLYEWKITVIAINSSENDETTFNNSISKYDAVYFHLKLTGGEPGESVRITAKPTFPDGEVGEYVFEEKWRDGDILWYGWSGSIYENPQYGQTGTLRCNFYDDQGNLIGAGSVSIVASVANDDNSTVNVYTAQELVNSIGSNKKIVLKSNYYDLSNVSLNNLYVVQQQNGKGFIIKNASNLIIEGNAEIVIGDQYADVLSFEDCSNISLKGLTVGHKNSFSSYRCEGAVLRFVDCNTINLTDCNLYGCGAQGVWATSVNGLYVKSTEIYDCTYAGLWISKSSNVEISDSSIYDLPSCYAALRIDDSQVKFTSTSIKNTNSTTSEGSTYFIDVFDSTYSGSSISFDKCNVESNAFAVITNLQKGKLIFTNCTFADNKGNTAHNSVTYTNCTFDQSSKSAARQTLVSWVKNNYLTYEDDCMTYSAYSDDSTYYALEYDVSDDHLYMGVSWEFEDGDTMFLLLSLDSDTSEYNYSATYVSGTYQNKTQGTINASTFTGEGALTYTTYTGDYWNKDILLNLYRSGYVDLIEFLDWCLTENHIGVDISDFGYTNIQFVD